MRRFGYDASQWRAFSPFLQECPTHWRIYDYLSDNGRDSTLNDRETKKDLPLGVGGEGYIGPEDWCFNCGDAGHLGDVSQVALAPSSQH